MRGRLRFLCAHFSRPKNVVRPGPPPKNYPNGQYRAPEKRFTLREARTDAHDIQCRPCNSQPAKARHATHHPAAPAASDYRISRASGNEHERLPGRASARYCGKTHVCRNCWPTKWAASPRSPGPSAFGMPGISHAFSSPPSASRRRPSLPAGDGAEGRETGRPDRWDIAPDVRSARRHRPACRRSSALTFRRSSTN